MTRIAAVGTTCSNLHTSEGPARRAARQPGTSMTGPELRAALDEIGMSQREFASRFGLDETSVSRWMHAKRAVPSWVSPALDLLRCADRKTNGTTDNG